MEKQKNAIDAFFRETLRDHSIVPSEKAKEAFLKDASGIERRKWYRGGLFLFSLIAILLIVGGTAIYFIPGKTEENKTIGPDHHSGPLSAEASSGQHATHLQPAETSSTSLTVPDNSTRTSAKRFAQNAETSSKAAEPSENKTPVKYDGPGNQPDEIFVKNLPVPEPVTASASPTLIPATDEPSHEKLPETVNHQEMALIPQVVAADSMITASSPAGPETEKKQQMNRDWYISATLQCTPEWMFNTLEDVKFVTNFGVEGVFTMGNYSVRTGLELSIAKGTNELVVEYNDFLGSYNKLDSMSFAWDGANNDYIPSYYFSNQDVWDSLMKLDYPKVVKRYTYLQIPLILGYDFFHSGRFSFGLRAGPLLSILIHSKQLSAEYDPGKNRVIRINNITPEQVNLNWQFMGGINASVKLTDRLLFELEPMAKYYFNSVYEKADISKKPWSIGVRAAFIIKL